MDKLIKKIESITRFSHVLAERRRTEDKRSEDGVSELVKGYARELFLALSYVM